MGKQGSVGNCFTLKFNLVGQGYGIPLPNMDDNIPRRGIADGGKSRGGLVGY